MVSRQSASVIYHVSPPTVAMILNEGAWTDDDSRKIGGYFASPLTKDSYVALDTSANMRVKAATASSDVVIGKLLSDPQGKHETYGRQGTVLLFGTDVAEIEVHTASGAIAVGASVQFSSSGGYFGEGVWAVDGTANDSIALSAFATGSGTGSSVVVLFGRAQF